MKSKVTNINGYPIKMVRHNDNFYIKLNNKKYKLTRNEVENLGQTLSEFAHIDNSSLFHKICGYFLTKERVISCLKSLKLEPNFNSLMYAVKGTARHRPLVEVRQAFCYYSRLTSSELRLKDIGRMLGRRDHSTIIYSIATFDQLSRTYYRTVKEDLDRLLL